MSEKEFHPNPAKRGEGPKIPKRAPLNTDFDEPQKADAPVPRPERSQLYMLAAILICVAAMTALSYWGLGNSTATITLGSAVTTLIGALAGVTIKGGGAL